MKSRSWSKLYNKLAEAEEEARKTFLEALPGDPFADIYQAKMNERTALKHMVADEPAADVAPVVHGLPILRYRPERYEWYEATGLNENGEPLYVKRVRIDEKSWAMYCPACGKRLCSRFNNYCPHCGAKMDGGKSNGKT